MGRPRGSKNKAEVKYTPASETKREVITSNPWGFKLANPTEQLKDILRDIVNGDCDKNELLDKIDKLM